jgi:HAD superfamily phosphoserine phosphatase-like hydrolase
VFHDIVRSMLTASVSSIIDAIDSAAKEAPGGAIATDGDGTLWSGDIGEDFWDAFMKRGPNAELTREALAFEAAAAGLPTTGSAHDIAHAIHAAYLAGTFSEERVCEVITWIAAGWTVEELDAFCTETIEAIGLRSRLHGETIAVIEHARKRGIDVFLVSASPRAIVDAAARVVGIPAANVTAVRERAKGGIVECAVIRPIPYGEGKVTRLREKLGSRTLYAAFGDNAFDVPLLQSAQHPLAVRPKQRLLDRAAEVPNLRILERI